MFEDFLFLGGQQGIGNGVGGPARTSRIKKQGKQNIFYKSRHNM